MKKKYRLLKRVDFQEVLKNGTKFYSRNFVCYCIVSSDVDNVRIGIIIPKKKCKLSNKRKYLKRVFWAFNTKDRLNSFPNSKCVFMYRDFFYSNFLNKNINFMELDNEYFWLMNNLFKKIR